jgi:hypothetical protein
MGFLVKSLGKSSTNLILMTRELSENVSGIPIILLTKNRELLQAASFTGLKTLLFQGFSRIEVDITGQGMKSEYLNWDNILKNIQVDTENRVIQVELTLLSKSCAPKWIISSNDNPENPPVVVAEGTGIIHGEKDLRFTWTLPFLACDSTDLEEESSDDSDQEAEGGISSPDTEDLDLGTVYMDFGGLENTVSPVLYQTLEKKLNECASPLAFMEDMPTVQDPLVVMKQLLIFEYAFQNRHSQLELSQKNLEEFEQQLKSGENLLNWAHYWLKDREADASEVDISFSEFLNAMKSCWSIGDTFKIELRNMPAEISNIKGGTGE